MAFPPVLMICVAATDSDSFKHRRPTLSNGSRQQQLCGNAADLIEANGHIGQDHLSRTLYATAQPSLVQYHLQVQPFAACAARRIPLGEPRD